MRPVAPRVEGADEFVIAEDQLEFMPITACLVQYSDGQVVRLCRWTFTPEERARVAAGEDLFFGTPAGVQLIPHWFRIGGP